MKNNKMQHAMYAAAILGVYLLIKFYITIYAQVVFLGMVLTLFVPYLVFMFQKKYRDGLLQGKITYSDAFTYGIYLFFFASLILGLGQFVFYNFINPEYLINTYNAAIDMMRQIGMPEAIIDEAIVQGPFEPISFVLQAILLNSVLGLLISAVTANFVKKTDLPNPANE
jgi:hypothetical protein